MTKIMRGEETEQTLARSEFGGDRIVNIDVSAKDRIKAGELLGKRYGLWTESVEAEESEQLLIVDDIAKIVSEEDEGKDEE